ncbi:MAG: NAD(P)-dependent oxidoreductase [Gammaproteobacteria bacterium]
MVAAVAFGLLQRLNFNYANIRWTFMKIGFAGLGRMGSGMASRLVAAGLDVTVFNRSEERTRPLVQLGAQPARTLSELANTDVVFTMLADDRAVEEMVLASHGLLHVLKPGSIHVSCSTISVALSAALARAHLEFHQGYVALPVFGRPEAAAAGKGSFNDPVQRAQRDAA